MIKNIFFSVVIVTLAWSCQTDSDDTTTLTTTTAATEVLSFGRVSFKEKSKSCVTDSSQCAQATAVYPLARGANDVVTQKINTALRTAVAQSVGLFGEPDSIPLGPQQAAKVFVTEYDDFLAEFPDSPAGWASETKGEVLYQSDKVVTVELNTYAYTGGAHPNSYVRLLSFAPQTGDLTPPLDLISDTMALKQIAEKAFRAERNILPTQNWDSAGFWFENGFALPTEMGIVEDGLKLFYNAYEVAPYAAGQTEFTIPRVQLKGILKE